MKIGAGSNRTVTQIVKARAFLQVTWLLPVFFIMFAAIGFFAPIRDWSMLIVAPMAIWLLTALFILAGWSALKLTTENIELRSLKTLFLRKTISMKQVVSFEIKEVVGTDVMPERSFLEVFSTNDSSLGKFWLFPENANPFSEFLISIGKRKL